MTWYVTLEHDSYREARSEFDLNLPADYNIARDCVRKHDDGSSVALYQGYPDGSREQYTFRELDVLSNRLANGLSWLGVTRGDRVAVVLPQRPESLITHLACWKMGAISVPLSVLFGTDALEYRLTHSGATVVFTNGQGVDKIEEAGYQGNGVQQIVTVDEPRDGCYSFDDLIADETLEYEIAATTPETPALIIYTSGTTDSPKGVLHRHELCAGHCPTAYMYCERNIIGNAVGWTPASWAWVGGLLNLVLTMWHYGRPAVGYPMGGFDSETAFEILEEFDVTDAGIPPTALRMMRSIENPRERYSLSLQVINSGGEAVTEDIHQWADAKLDVKVNEIYGLSEAASLVTNCHDWFERRPGTMGRPVPGHEVSIVDPETGTEKLPGETGEIAVRVEDDPTVFEEYWREPERTSERIVAGWLLTGDRGERNSEAFFTFHGRADDLIVTSGHRVSPQEVEKTILEHDAVEGVGVVGVPDETRGKVIKAFVVPAQGIEGTESLRRELQELVRTRLAEHEYPRMIEFVDQLPQTTTGKIKRRELRDDQ